MKNADIATSTLVKVVTHLFTVWAAFSKHIQTTSTKSRVHGVFTVWTGGARQVFDAVSEFAGFRSLEATEYMWLHYVNATTTMSKTNPGYQVLFCPCHELSLTRQCILYVQMGEECC